jgi:outer membrane protein assembly factor BamB
MKRLLQRWISASAVLAIAVASTNAAEPASGWRGNQTGLWPNANPPVEWRRTPKGALAGLRATAHWTKDKEPANAAVVEKGLIRDWLVIGPFAVDDSVKDFDRDFLGQLGCPSAGNKVRDREWKVAAVPPDDIMVFGTAELPWLDLGKALGFQKNQIGYAHTYLNSPRGGPARIVADHGHGMMVRLNDKQVYRSPKSTYGLGFYTALSRIELNHSDQQSPSFDVELKPGWNRLLLKLASANVQGPTDWRCSLRIIESPAVQYESANILWMTPLPARSTSTPIIVGDYILIMLEPDELWCIDKKNGKVLWCQFINYFAALTPEEKKAKSAYAAIDRMVDGLDGDWDRVSRRRKYAAIKKALLEIDQERFKLAANDHFEAHFGIVGFTMPTPVSDGKHVYVWNGMGVAACFDLDGKRQWITRIKTDHLSYGSSPALVDGVLAVFLNEMFGLDAKTGKQLWKQPKVRYNVAALLGATFNGKNVIVTQRGDVINPVDGEFLYRQRDSAAANDTGWSPPVILGNRMYLPKYGVGLLSILDFGEATGDAWEPKLIGKIEMPREINNGPGGKWIDRWTAGSPLVHDGYVYQCDIYQMLYVSELQSRKLVYRQSLPLNGFTHYNAVAVAASCTLVGKHVMICDNQGTTVVIEPGSKYKVVSVNRIETQLARTLPIPAQETLTYSPPIADGDRLYLRGEAFLYCVGKK